MSSNYVMDKSAQNQIKDLKHTHDEKINILNNDINSSKMLAIYLIEEIEKYKT